MDHLVLGLLIQVVHEGGERRQVGLRRFLQPFRHLLLLLNHLVSFRLQIDQTPGQPVVVEDTIDCAAEVRSTTLRMSFARLSSALT